MMCKMIILLKNPKIRKLTSSFKWGFLLSVFLLATGFTTMSLIKEVYSGNTFRIDSGDIIRAVYCAPEGGTYELVCDEPLASTIARQKLFGQSVTIEDHGIDPSGTKLVTIMINGTDYVSLLAKASACKRNISPINLSIPDAPKLYLRQQPAVSGNKTSSEKTTEGNIPLNIYTEAYWQRAFNEQVAKGALEVSVEGGRADIVNSEYAIEVDRASKYHEAIGQALHYSQKTGKKPCIALFDDGSPNAEKHIAEAEKICAGQGIKVYRINDYVPSGYQVKIVNTNQARVNPSWLQQNSSGFQRTYGTGLHTGPRGGIYYINSSGNKEYVTDQF